MVRATPVGRIAAARKRYHVGENWKYIVQGGSELLHNWLHVSLRSAR